jgi:hypothetical protein
MRRFSYLLVLAATLLTGTLRAQVPQLVNYQGRVAVDSVNFEGTGQFKFALVDNGGAVTFWSNDGTSVAGSEPAAAVTLTVAKGLYSLLLGDTALGNMTAIPAGVFSNPDVRLRVWFNDGVNGSQLLSPDQRLAPATYLADGTVTTASIANGAVTSANIAPASINGSNIAPGSLDFTHLTVPAAPGAGQVLGFDGTSLSWTAGGTGVFSLNGTSAYYNGGRVGIGTSDPHLGLQVNNGTLGVTGVNTGINVIGAGRGVFISTGTSEGYIFATDFGTFPNTPIPLILQNTTGAVGIGNSPRAGYRLEVAGATAWTTTGSGGDFLIHTPNGESGFTILGSARADLRFDGTTLKLVAGPGGAIPSSASGVAITTAGNVGIGTATPTAKLHVVGTTRTSVLTITGGVDLAEPFQMKEEQLEKGSVVVIDDEHPGRLKRSRNAYDKRVAGIVSGANGINPGISLHQEGVVEGGQDVALTGRVYVQADASTGAIAPGDMLTTSDTPGYAMKVRDPRRAQGAVIGKAMSPLSEGRGMVLVLVTLQ